jgi:hypothetical protein
MKNWSFTHHFPTSTSSVQHREQASGLAWQCGVKPFNSKDCHHIGVQKIVSEWIQQFRQAI